MGHGECGASGKERGTVEKMSGEGEGRQAAGGQVAARRPGEGVAGKEAVGACRPPPSPPQPPHTIWPPVALAEARRQLRERAGSKVVRASSPSNR